jgi:hypothetical protein
MALNIAAINEGRLRTASMFQISNIGWRKKKPVSEQRVHALTWQCLVAAIVLQKLLKQNLDCKRQSQWSQFSISPLERWALRVEFISAHARPWSGYSAVGIATMH